MTLRIWNYVERTQVFSKQFSDVPLGVAIHPSSYMVIV